MEIHNASSTLKPEALVCFTKAPLRVVILELKKAVYAWVGPAKPQPLSSGQRSVMLLGNYDQAYVPDLAPAEAMASEAAVLAYYGSV